MLYREEIYEMWCPPEHPISLAGGIFWPHSTGSYQMPQLPAIETLCCWSQLHSNVLHRLSSYYYWTNVTNKNRKLKPEEEGQWK